MQYVSFHDKYVELRNSLHLTRSQMARQGNISYSMLNNLDNNKNNNLKSLDAVAFGFNLIPIVFYQGKRNLIFDLNKYELTTNYPLNLYVGKIIKKRREEQNLDQEELADLVGVTSNNTISGWERGDRSPNLHHLDEVCKMLDLVPSYLVPKNI